MKLRDDKLQGTARFTCTALFISAPRNIGRGKVHLAKTTYYRLACHFLTHFAAGAADGKAAAAVMIEMSI